MNKYNLLIRKGAVAMSALIIIMLFFVYYFSVYTPGRENELNQRGFRILSRVEENIYSKKKNILSIIDKVISKKLPIDIEVKDKDNKLSNLYKLDKKSNLPEESIKKIDAIYSNILKDNDLNGLKYHTLIRTNYWESAYNYSQFYPRYDDYTDKWKIYFFGDNYKVSQGTPKDNFSIIEEDSTVIMYEYEVENFLKDILFFRDDFFKEYLILQNDSIVYQTKNSSQQLVYKGDCSALNRSLDTKSGRSKLLSDHIQKDTIAGKEYYVFYHPFEVSSNINFTLCGLIPVDEYNTVKYRLNIPDILMITLLLVIIIISFPIIKIIFMSKFERLTRFDVYSLMTAMVLGTSVATIFFLFSMHKKNESEKQLFKISKMNNLVQSNFLQEIKNSLEELTTQKNKYQRSRPYKKWLKNNLSKEYCIDTDLIQKYFNTNDSGKFYQYTESMLFIDSLGKCKARWSKGVDNSPDIDLNERKYVSHFLNKTREELFVIDSTEFYLQPIYSWQDGANTVVISKKEEDIDRSIFLVALETRFFSVTNPIVSKDVGFCIINKEGDVLFHSDNNRNLRENLIEESSENSQILSAIYSRTSSDFEFTYNGKEHLGYIAPVKDLPFYVVTFNDKTTYFESEANIAMFTIVLLISLFGILITLLFTFVCLVKRTTYLRKQLNVRFIRFSHLNYTLYKELLHYFLVINSVGILLSLGMVYLCDSLNQLYLSVGLPILSLLVVAKLFSKRRVYDVGEFVLKKHRIFILFFSICFLLACVITLSYGTVVQRICTIVISLVFSGIYFFGVQKTTLLFRSKNYMKYQGFVVAFVVFAFLFNSSIFPTVNFYMIAVEEDNLLSIKRSGLELAESAEKRNSWLYGSPKFSKLLEVDSPNFTTFKKGIYDNSIQLNKGEFVGEVTENYISDFFVNVVYLSKMDIDEYEIRKKLLWKDNDANNDSWIWMKEKEVLNCKFINTFLGNTTHGVNSIVISFASVHASLLSDLNVGQYFFFIVIAILIVLVFYFLFSFMYKQITLFDHFNDLKGEPVNENYFIENIEEGHTNLLILSLPGTLVLKKIDTSLNVAGYHQTDYHYLKGLGEVGIKFLFYAKIGGKTTDKKIVLLPFFDLKGEDPKNYIDKIKALESLFIRSDIKLIWVTSIDPFEQIEVLKKVSVNAYTQRLKNNELNHDALKLDHDYEKILRILDDFYLVKYRLEKNTISKIKLDVSKIGKRYVAFIKKEFMYGHYLNVLGGQYNDMLIDAQRTESIDKELLILRIQDICKNYYYSVWSCLSNKEKYILYDLAMDGLTNCKNFTILMELKDKGVLYFDKRDNTLKIFNKSFMEFILSVVDPSEASVLEKEINTIGTWSVIKLILTLFFIAFGIFLFYTQQGFMNRMLGILTATSSLIPIIINLFSLSKNYKGK